MTAGAPETFADLAVGMTASTPVVVTDDDMAAFAALSGDRSRIHVDADYARAVGFEGKVVYGGLLVAALSRLVGMMLPGSIGVAAGWRIDFHSPLYVGQEAVLEAELVQLSEAARLAKLKYTIQSGDRLIAKGSAEAKILV